MYTINESVHIWNSIWSTFFTTKRTFTDKWNECFFLFIVFAYNLYWIHHLTRNKKKNYVFIGLSKRKKLLAWRLSRGWTIEYEIIDSTRFPYESKIFNRRVIHFVAIKWKSYAFEISLLIWLRFRCQRLERKW